MRRTVLISLGIAGFMVIGGLFVWRAYSLSRTASGTFHYHFEECTGNNQFVVVDGNDQPVEFDPAGSDQRAFRTLMSLSYPILYPARNRNRIYVVGRYYFATKIGPLADDPPVHRFILSRWFVEAPFQRLTERLDTVALPTPQLTAASDLIRSDFDWPNAFGLNPYSRDFRPDDFVVRSGKRRH